VRVPTNFLKNIFLLKKKNRLVHNEGLNIYISRHLFFCTTKTPSCTMDGLCRLSQKGPKVIKPFSGQNMGEIAQIQIILVRHIHNK
jgi:hypothetical protein